MEFFNNSNYYSNGIRKYLLSNKIRMSNSRKGNCWDNAAASPSLVL
ncbi:hypothetical protein LEP1GSC059_1380 [Leptospira noguchii serovar Panama str. CZ214]|uniref:Uncharacterized protein n=1 Tax=Leptospira noguchii serovar Panama str. CZ214 TaxID=1001595 RepID=T0GZ78_9LEPT|nr:hypothetical protein LEP1GSC059_1380 [Leptospira noguchii serovar Panama str. CZ214]